MHIDIEPLPGQERLPASLLEGQGREMGGADEL